jgi:hypothetical protein
MSRILFVLAAVVLLALGRPAAAQTASPEATAAAKELVEAMRATDQLKVLMPMLMQQLKPAIVQGRAEVERDYDQMVPEMLAIVDARMGEFVDSIATLYASHFNADELSQLTAFYRGPVGQKFLQIMPRIMQDSMAIGQKFGESIALDTRNRMIEELRKRGHKI